MKFKQHFCFIIVTFELQHYFSYMMVTVYII